MSDPMQWALVEAADAVAAKEISARELAEASIAKVAARQPTLNCFISVDAEGALVVRDVALQVPQAQRHARCSGVGGERLRLALRWPRGPRRWHR